MEKAKKSPPRKKEFLKNIVKLRPCAVCEADSTGFHFGIFSCEACKSFFRRSVKRQPEMVCPRDGKCNIKFGQTKGTPCSACRIKRCFEVGMSLNAVKKGRYTLEKRAETIKDSREYWKTSSTLPSKEPSPRVSPSAKPPSVNAGSPITYTSSSSSQSDSSENVDSPSSSDFAIRSMLMSPPGSLFSLDTPDPASLDMDENCCGVSGVGEPLASSQNHDQEVNFVELCGGTEELGLAGYIGNQQNLLHERNVATNFEYETESAMASTPRMGLSLSDSLPNDAVPTEAEDLSGTKNSNLAPIQELLRNRGYGLIEAIDNLSKTLKEHRTFHSDPNQPTASKILSGLFDQDESLEQFMKKINAPPNDLDEAITNNINDDEGLLDGVIKQTTDAYAQQNIMNRGFMAKISDFQHRFLVDKEERERLFGPMKPLTIAEHQKFFDDTGIDLEGKLDRFEKYVRFILVPHMKKVAAYICDLPGVRTLSVGDRCALLKYSKGEYKLTTQFAAFNVSHKLFTIAEGNSGATLDYHEVLTHHSQEVIDRAFEGAKILQNLNLTDQEYAMLSAVAIVRPEPCVTDDGKNKCVAIRKRLFQALEKLLRKRLTEEEAQRLAGILRLAVRELNCGALRYATEWDNKFLSRRKIKWPRIILDLMISPLPPEEDCPRPAQQPTDDGVVFQNL